jgi:hypothetical protein
MAVVRHQADLKAGDQVQSLVQLLPTAGMGSSTLHQFTP